MRAKLPKERLSRYLNIAALVQPATELFRTPLDQRIALGMSDDGRNSRKMQLVQRLLDIGGNRKVIQFHKQVILLIYSVLGGVGPKVLQVFITQMKIASGT